MCGSPPPTTGIRCAQTAWTQKCTLGVDIRGKRQTGVKTIENELVDLLKLRDNAPGVLKNRENTRLEFKQSFNLGSKPRYAKTMAAFANNRGGYIVFGVEPKPHRLIGINQLKFEDKDPALLTQFLDAHFTPTLTWEINTTTFAGIELAYIYTHEARQKPVVTIRNCGDDLKEGDIYFRYNARSTTIQATELIRVIQDRIDRETQALLQHLNVISNAGPSNVALLDTLKGKIVGPGAQLLIDEQLLGKLKFIREGQFSETAGAQTLRLVGDVQAGPVVGPTKRIPAGIHFDDLLRAFLRDDPLDPVTAKSYLRETVYQNTPNLPIHFFVSRAKLKPDEAIGILRSERTGFKHIRNELVRRLSNQSPVAPVGVVDPGLTSLGPRANVQAAVKSVGEQKLQKSQRSRLLAVLKRDPSAVFSARPRVHVRRILEATTHLEVRQAKRHRSTLCAGLLSIYDGTFGELDSVDLSIYRKAVARLDSLLYARA